MEKIRAPTNRFFFWKLTTEHYEVGVEWELRVIHAIHDKNVF